MADWHDPDLTSFYTGRGEYTVGETKHSELRGGVWYAKVMGRSETNVQQSFINKT